MNLIHYPAITSRAQTYRQTTLSNNTTPPTSRVFHTNRRTDRLHLSVPQLHNPLRDS